MTPAAGRNTTMAKIFTIDIKEISMVRPIRSSTRAGSENGAKREEMTTIINTNIVEAFKRFEIKGATTPVEIPDRSKTGRAYSGQIAWVRKKRLAGMTNSFNKHRTKRMEVVFFIFRRTATNSIFKKLRNNKNIIK
jgi:hypothetical protein